MTLVLFDVFNATSDTLSGFFAPDESNRTWTGFANRYPFRGTRDEAVEALKMAGHTINSQSSRASAAIVNEAGFAFGRLISASLTIDNATTREHTKHEIRRTTVQTIVELHSALIVLDLEEWDPAITQCIPTGRGLDFLRYVLLFQVTIAVINAIGWTARDSVMELASRPEVLALSADILKSIESNALQLSSSFEALTSTSGKVRTALQNITLATYNSISKAARQGVDIVGRRYFWVALWSNNKISTGYRVIAWYSEPDKDGTINEFRWRGGAITTSLVSTRQFWVNISYAARNRYKRSACISLAAIDSFIRHLEDGGEESGTGRFILVEDFDESTFELGPRSMVRRAWTSGDIFLEWSNASTIIISEHDRMQEAQARGCFSPSTPLNMLQATLHDLILDSTDVITSIQYLDGFELREHTDGPSWDTAKADLCRRFLSSFTPNGVWDDCSARHALRDKRRPGLQFDFQLQTTLKSIKASLLQCRRARLQWRWSARNSCAFDGDTLVADGQYLDTILLIGDSIYIAERVTFGTSILRPQGWTTVPWRPANHGASLVALEKELERLNSVLTKLRQSDARYKTLVTMKFVSVPLVAFASCIAGIGGIVSATGRAQLALAVLGLIAAFAAFVLSFLDGTIALQLQRTMNRIAKANKASARFEGTA